MKISHKDTQSTRDSRVVILRILLRNSDVGSRLFFLATDMSLIL